jgi:predicted RNase H-like HicB family nuclease
MNDLQLTLLIVGGGGIAAMIAYNWWQDYRLRNQASERFGQTDEDPLLNTGVAKSGFERSEPGFSGSSHPDSDLSFDEAADDSSSEMPLNDNNLQNELQITIDKRLFADFIVRFDEEKDANSWKALADGLEQINRKRIIYSASPDSAESTETLWFKASPYAGTARSLRASVQIANRKGPLSSIEFSEVLGKLKRFAEDQNADIEFPEMKEVVAKAETLDQAAAALDTLLGLHCLLPDTVQESTAVDMLAVAGWVQKGHQWFLSDESGSLASMVIHNAPGKRLLSFSIDVPNSAEPVKALGDIVTVCHGMNEKFGAPLMDDSGRTLSTQAIEGIYNQLIERVRNLTDSGFKPGTTVARILFS